MLAHEADCIDGGRNHDSSDRASSQHKGVALIHCREVLKKVASPFPSCTNISRAYCSLIHAVVACYYHISLKASCNDFLRGDCLAWPGFEPVNLVNLRIMLQFHSDLTETWIRKVHIIPHILFAMCFATFFLGRVGRSKKRLTTACTSI